MHALRMSIKLNPMKSKEIKKQKTIKTKGYELKFPRD